MKTQAAPSAQGALTSFEDSRVTRKSFEKSLSFYECFLDLDERQHELPAVYLLLPGPQPLLVADKARYRACYESFKSYGISAHLLGVEVNRPLTEFSTHRLLYFPLFNRTLATMDVWW
jgi:hypothetical protein